MDIADPLDDATYSVMTTGITTPHHCGYNLSAKFGKEWPVGTVVRCDICHSTWKKMKYWADGTATWRKETQAEKRRRTRREKG